MRKSIIAAGATTAAVVVAMTGLAGPAAAAEDQWVMPTTRGEILQTAINDVRAAAGGAELDLRFVPRHVNQEVYNYSNWAVCASSPSAGKNISQKTKRVIFSLRRLNEKC